MVTGDADHFPYRAGGQLNKFFQRCGFPFVHDGLTRATLTTERLTELNLGSRQSFNLAIQRSLPDYKNRARTIDRGDIFTGLRHSIPPLAEEYQYLRVNALHQNQLA